MFYRRKFNRFDYIDGVRGTLCISPATDRKRGPRDRPRTPLESSEMKIASSPCELHFLHRLKGGAGRAEKCRQMVGRGKCIAFSPGAHRGARKFDFFSESEFGSLKLDLHRSSIWLLRGSSGGSAREPRLRSVSAKVHKVPWTPSLY